MNQRTTWQLASISTFAIMAIAGSSSAQVAATNVVKRAQPGELQLVEVEKSFHDRLVEVEQLIRTNKYDAAAEALHEIMVSPDKPGFFRDPDDARRYGNTIEAASRLLGSLPMEALDAYGRRHDMAATELLDTARQRGDASALDSVAARYFHTISGGQALQLVASLAFDQGQYLKAAAAWETLYREHRRLKADRAMLLGKACAAYRLAGARNQAEQLMRLAETNHPGAEITVAGRKVPLKTFLGEVLAREPDSVALPLPPVADWSSLAGAPHSVAVMRDCDVAPLPVSGSAAAEGGMATNLAASAVEVQIGAVRGQTVKFDGGRIRIARPMAGGEQLMFDIPPMIHPVAVGGLVLCRTEDGISAVTAGSGKDAWRIKGLPVVQTSGGGEGKASPYLAMAGDMGRRAISIGDGRMYVLGRFSRTDAGADETGDESQSEEEAGSSLAALSFNEKGATPLWEIGKGKGEQDSLKKSRFIAVPTFHAGRLYTIARYGNRYQALCLDAATGSLVWQTPIGLVPMREGSSRSPLQSLALELVTERGTPPAVADGVAFFLTNAGVIIALDAGTGAPVWAHRYDSRVSGSMSKPSIVNVQGQALALSVMRRPFNPVNPTIVTQGLVICLPCDSDDVLAVDARTGHLMWRVERKGLQDLAAVDRSRILLSGPDLVLLRAQDGSILHREAGRILGRPAVTGTKVLASGDGAIVKMDLSTRAVVEMATQDSRAVLGTMLVAGGRLVAANTSGLTVYTDYEDASRTLKALRERARTPPERVAIGLSLGQTALLCGRPETAAAELAAVLGEAEKSGDADLTGRARTMLFETRMAQSEGSTAQDEKERLLGQAMQYAATVGQRQQVLLARVAVRERSGRPVDAVRILQEVVERHAGRLVAPKDGGKAHIDAAQEYEFAHRELGRLVRQHGEAVYEAFDAPMSEAIDRAIAEKDPSKMVLAWERWPYARRSAEALLSAADDAFRQATAGPASDLAMAMKASRLANAARDIPRAAGGTAGLAAQAIIDLRLRPRAAIAFAEALKGTNAGAAVTFGGVSGTAADVAARIVDAGRKPLPPTDAEFGYVSSPMRLVYELQGVATEILRDCRGQPIRLGDCLFLSRDRELICIDTQRGDYERARLWSLDMPEKADRKTRVGQLVSNARHLAIYDQNFLWLVDMPSRKVLYRQALDWFGTKGWLGDAGEEDWLALSDEKENIYGIRLSDGSRFWDVRAPNLKADSIEVRGGVLTARRAKRMRNLFLDIRTGRAFADPAVPGQPAPDEQTALTPEGLVVTLQPDGTVLARDARGSRGIGSWKTNLESGGWHIFGVGSRFLGLRKQTGAEPIRVLDLSDIGRTIEIKVTDSDGTPRRPNALVFQSNRALLVHGTASTGDLVSPAMTAFDLPSGKALWTKELAPEITGACRVAQVAPYGNAVAVAVAAAGNALSNRQLVLALGDGSLFDCQAEMKIRQKVASGAWSPVVMNGRVVVAGDAGVSCLRTVEH
jgi:outer membrane protein assembly factor BamB